MVAGDDWSCMMHDDPWWIMMHDAWWCRITDDSQWFMIITDASFMIRNDAWSSMMHHDAWFMVGLPKCPGGLGRKILPPECRQTCWEAKWAWNGSPWEPWRYRLYQFQQFFEAKRFVKTGGRQNPYFGSKWTISGSTFPVDFWWIFGVPLTHEKPPFNK